MTSSALEPGTAPRWPWLARRRRWVALGLVVAIAVGALGWTYRHDIRRLLGSRSVAPAPAFLEPGNPIVLAARRGATQATEVVGRARDAIHALMPAFAELWGTGTRYGFEPASVQLWIDQHAIRLRSFGTYRVPRDPTWSENPFRNISWEADYQSLAWLRAPEAAYEQTGKRTYLYQVKAYVLDWIADASTGPAPSDRTWYDDTVSIRTNVLVALLTGDLWGALGNQQLATVLGSLEQHGTVLDGYLRDPRFAGHNHNLFHALALYNLAVAFPELRGAAAWRTDARARISALLPELVDGAGVSTEEAAWYHFVVLDTYTSAAAYLARNHDPLSAAEQVTLASMASFGAVVLSPTGETPAIGDTPYGSKANLALLEDLAVRGLATDTTRFVLSHGAAGRRPPDAFFDPVAGYAVLRPTWSPGAAWSNDLQVIVDTTDTKRSHGHDDAMTVLLNAGGGPLLVDSGGPYLYGKRAHLDVIGAPAHNTVVDVGGSGGRGPVSGLEESDDATASIVAGTLAISTTATDRRAVILVKPGLLVVVDQLTATDATTHAFELYYHLPPNAVISPTLGNGTMLGGTVVAAPAGMGYRVAASGPLSATSIVGQEQPLLGWVTPAYGEKVAAPLLAFETSGSSAWFVTAFQASSGSAAMPDLAVQPDGQGGLVIDAGGAGGSARITVSASGLTAVTASEAN